MAITYPRDIRLLVDIPIPFQSMKMLLVSRVATARLNNSLHAMETGPKIWKISYQTSPLKDAQLKTVEAWLDTLGGAKTFLSHNLKFPTPTSLSLPATCPIIALTGNTITLSLSGTITEGDMIGLEQSGRYGLFRASETVAGGGSVTVTVSPSPLNLFTTAATARLQRPVGEFILDPSTPPDYTYGRIGTEVSFSAIQKAA
jgi:hypothetical protein